MCAPPASIELSVCGSCVGTGRDDPAVVPVPSAPTPLSPAQCTKPSVERKHVKLSPMAACLRPVKSTTGVGRLCATVSPTPSSPSLFSPQHCAVPSMSTAHVALYPAVTDCAAGTSGVVAVL